MAKHKKIIVPLAILLGLVFWPLAIGLLLSWLIYKFVSFKKIKYAAIMTILLPAFLINSIWTKALFNSDSYKNPPKAQTVQKSLPLQDQITIPKPPPIIEIPIITLTPTFTPTPTPTAVVTPLLTITTPKITTIPIQQSQSVVTQQRPITNTSGSYACNCSKTCTQITSCAEAQYQLNSCGCKQRDADHDGIACDSAPLHCQQ